jgi:hypothetical protein
MTGGAEPVRTVSDAILAELKQPLFPAAEAAARDIGQASPGAVAILFYGSCLRDGTDDGKILDFYVLADDLAAANGSRMLGFFNKVLPPNVFYRETDWQGRTVRSKYAVMSLDGFCRATQIDHLNPSFWARFAQPCALAWSRDEATADRTVQAVADAVCTAVAASARFIQGPFSADTLWSSLFELTYGAELRSENAATKGAEIFEQNAERYRLLTRPALAALGIEVMDEPNGMMSVRVDETARRREARRWRWRRVEGKALSILRLAKGAFTFQGGIDYLAWKIRRHSGVEIEIAPWQRRHPVVGGLYLMIRTRRSGAYR